MHARWRARLLAGLTVPLALAGALTGAGPAAGAAAAPCVGWMNELPQPDSPGPVSNTLSSVTVLSACNAYAAGVQVFAREQKTTSRIKEQLPVLPLIEHWDGTSWSVQATPRLLTGELHITGIRASSPATSGRSAGSATARTPRGP